MPTAPADRTAPDGLCALDEGGAEEHAETSHEGAGLREDAPQDERNGCWCCSKRQKDKAVLEEEGRKEEINTNWLEPREVLAKPMSDNLNVRTINVKIENMVSCVRFVAVRNRRRP